MIYPTTVSKEDFKRAYTTCLKEAWIMHSPTNFNLAREFNREMKLSFKIDLNVENDSEFDDDTASINLFEAFKEVFESENDLEGLRAWEAAWADINGFDFEIYQGDSITDGNMVGEKARELFGWKLFQTNQKTPVKKQELDLSHLNFEAALKRTGEVFKKGVKQYQYLYEAAFEFDHHHLKTRCDVLEVLDDHKVNLYEVKGTSKIKPEHFFDLVYQVFVLEKNGIEVNNIYICHLNKEYVFGYQNYLDLKAEAKVIEQQYQDWTYEQVVAYIKEKQLLTKFNNPVLDDLNLEKLFVLDDEWKSATKKTPAITLMTAYHQLLSLSSIDDLISFLAKKLVINDSEHVFHFLTRPLCETKMTYHPKLGWKFGQKAQHQESYCYHALPYFEPSKGDTIFNLTGSSSFSNRDKAEFYHQSKLLYLSDLLQTSKKLWPLKVNAKGEQKPFLRPEHERILRVYQSYLEHSKKVDYQDIIDIDHLNEFYEVLANYQTSTDIYMYDFETVKFALPQFWKSNPYQQIPFQYSIDIIYNQNYDYNNPTTMDHYDFLPMTNRDDPRPDFLVNFIHDMLLTRKAGVYVAYNKSFERTVLKYLAVEFPEFAPALIYIATHTIDLMDFFKGSTVPFRPWFLIYHPDFHGSYSIKMTQPSLEPSFNYADLVINKGDKAAQTFRQFVVGDLTDKQWEIIRPSMIAYCNRDTLAMVVILKRVEEMIKEYEKGEVNE